MSDGGANRIRILVVDDEREFLAALGQRLEMRDFDVTLVEDGTAALDLARERKFDLALVDLKMPGMDGREVLERLKAEHEFLEVIILTGHGSLGSAVECTKLGAFGYLPKPYDFEELIKVLGDAFAARLRRKFEADDERIRMMVEIAAQETPLGFLRRMKELDDERH